VPYFTNLTNPPWEESECKILLQFLSNAETKLPSTTWVALYNIIRHYSDTHNRKIFVDFAFFPTYKADFKVYIKNDLTIPVPLLSRRNLDEFDEVWVSNGTLTEISALPHLYVCSGINAFHTERLKTDEPLFTTGGQAAVSNEWLFGRVEINGKIYQGLLDFCQHGWGEINIPQHLDCWFDFNSKFGNPKLSHNKRNFIEAVVKAVEGAVYPIGFEQVYANEEDWKKGKISEIK
jgi:hypothetical protein